VGRCPTPRKLFEKSLTKNLMECALRIPKVDNSLDDLVKGLLPRFDDNGKSDIQL